MDSCEVTKKKKGNRKYPVCIHAFKCSCSLPTLPLLFTCIRTSVMIEGLGGCFMAPSSHFHPKHPSLFCSANLPLLHIEICRVSSSDQRHGDLLAEKIEGIPPFSPRPTSFLELARRSRGKKGEERCDIHVIPPPLFFSSSFPSIFYSLLFPKFECRTISCNRSGQLLSTGLIEFDLSESALYRKAAVDDPEMLVFP